MGIDWGLEGGKRFKTNKNKGKTTLVYLTHLQVRVLTGKAAQSLGCYCHSSEDQEVKEKKKKKWPRSKAVGPVLTLTL